MATPGAGGGGRYKFFKVLLPGTFELRLSIPPKFVAVLGGWHRRPWRAAAKLLRDGTGRSWDVDLHRDGDGDRVFLTVGGWRGFVSANGISAGQLLVFEHRGCLDLAVDIFDASGCLSVGNGLFHEAAAAINNAADTTGDKDCRRRPEAIRIKRRRMSSPTPSSTATITTTGSGDDDEATTLCMRIERSYQLQLLDVSKSFCERVGWTSSRDVELTCAGGRRWPVSVKVSAKNGMMCAGWKEFAQDNGVGLRDACVFVPSNGGVLHVRVIRQGATRGC